MALGWAPAAASTDVGPVHRRCVRRGGAAELPADARGHPHRAPRAAPSTSRTRRGGSTGCPSRAWAASRSAPRSWSWVSPPSGIGRMPPDQRAAAPGRRRRASAPQGRGAVRWAWCVAIVLGFIDDRWQIRARWQLLGQLAAGGHRARRRHHCSSRSPTRSSSWAGVRRPNLDLRVRPPVQRRRAVIQPVPVLLTTLWIVGMINSINWIDGLDGLSTGVSLIAALTLGVISITAHPSRAPGRPAVRGARGVARRVPALELPSGAGVHRHRRGDGRGLRPGRAVDPGHGQGRRGAAGPGRAHHRHLLDHHPAARQRAARPSSPTGVISTIDCSTWA